MNDEAKNRILDATEWLCEKRSPLDVTLDMVADRAKVGKGSIYRYFKSKDDLFQHVITERMIQLREQMIKVTLVSEGDYLDKLRAIVEKLGGFFDRHRVIIGMSMFLSKAPPFTGDRMKDPVSAVYSLIDDLIKSLIKVGVSKGEIRSDISPAVLTMFFHGVLAFGGRAKNNPEARKVNLNTIIDLFLNGVSARKMKL